MAMGAVLMLLLQYYVYVKLSLLPEQTSEQKDINAKYSLPSVSFHIFPERDF